MSTESPLPLTPQQCLSAIRLSIDLWDHPTKDTEKYFAKIRRYWMDDLMADKSIESLPDYPTGRDQGDRDRYFKSFANEMIALGIKHDRKSLNNPNLEAYASYSDLKATVLKRRRDEAREARRYISIDPLNDDKTDWASKRSVGRNSKREKLAIVINKNHYRDFDMFIQRINDAGRPKIADTIGKLKSFNLEYATKNMKNILEGKTIYEVARDYELKFRRLLYFLKQIKFPLESAHGTHLIAKERLPLLDRSIPLIRIYFEMSDNFKGWTNTFLNRGLSKSNTSKLISRRIGEGVIPKGFFYCVAPDPTNNLQLETIADKQRALLAFQNYEKWAGILITPEEIRARLGKLIDAA